MTRPPSDQATALRCNRIAARIDALRMTDHARYRSVMRGMADMLDRHDEPEAREAARLLRAQLTEGSV